MLLYPRLSSALATAELEYLRSRDEEEASQFVRFSHPKAVPAATGGRRADEADLRELRAGVMHAWEQGGVSSKGEFDRALGKVLHEGLQISRADAAHPETWNFLTLLVFPDVLVRRFPDPHRDRALGSPRNVLRRVWLREHLIGPVAYSTDAPLQEEEYVAIVERTAMARIPHLAQCVAGHLVVLKLDNRALLTRQVMLRLTRLTGPLDLACLPYDHLNDLVEGAVSEALEVYGGRTADAPS